MMMMFRPHAFHTQVLLPPINAGASIPELLAVHTPPKENGHRLHKRKYIIDEILVLDNQ